MPKKPNKDRQPKKARQRHTTKESKTKRHTENKSSSGLGEMETAALKGELHNVHLLKTAVDKTALLSD